MPKVDLKNLSKSSVIHFIGADGIGMSSIAEVLLKMGFAVQGSNEIDEPSLFVTLTKKSEYDKSQSSPYCILI